MSAFEKMVMKHLQSLPVRNLPEGTQLIKENSSFDSVYFLKSGALQVSRDGIDIAQVERPGSVFGEMSYFLERPATASVRAMDDSEVWVVEAPGLYFVDHPEVLIYVARVLCVRIANMNAVLVDGRERFMEDPDHFMIYNQMMGALLTQRDDAIWRPEPEEDEEGEEDSG